MASALAQNITEMFRLHPSVDLRTPRTTFDTFCRAVLTEQPMVLWETIHPDLRMLLQRRLQIEGVTRFFGRMKPIVSSPAGRLTLGPSREVGSSAVVCPLYRGAHEVGKAWFAFHNRQWVLSQLT
jgi:hypothetical protein